MKPKKYEIGGGPKPKPTMTDSLQLYNNAVKVQQYYKNYKKGPALPLPAGKNWLTALDSDVDYFNRANKPSVITPNGVTPKSNIVYRKDIDSNKFMQREGSSDMIDTRAPMQLYDRRIKPQKQNILFNQTMGDSMIGDAIEQFGYDPIAVKPYSMLTPSEMKVRQRKYPVPQPPVKTEVNYTDSMTPYENPQTMKGQGDLLISEPQLGDGTTPSVTQGNYELNQDYVKRLHSGIKKGYGGYSIDPIKSKNRLTTFENNQSFSPEAIKWPKAESVDTTAIESSSETSGANIGSIANTAGTVLDTIGNIGKGVAKTVSTGLDLANGMFGAMENAQLKRTEQQKIAEALQKRPYENMNQQGVNNIPVYTKFGGVAKIEGGDKNPNVEAEDGEILEHADGSMFEADGNRHEQGGEMYSNINRVLEDTAGKRKDPLSKYLVIDKETAATIVGKPVKRGMSHAKVFSEATEQMNKIQAKYVTNIEAVENKKNPNKISLNSARLNTKFGNELPTSAQLFDTLFEHQEKVKEDYSAYEAQRNGVPKAAYGIGPITPYGGNKNKKKTPTGRVNKFTPEAGFQDYVDQWNTKVPGASETADARDFQSAIYDHLMSTPAGQKEIARMWRANGNTEYGTQSGTGKGLDFDNLSVANLAVLKGAYVDDKLGVRKLDPNYDTQTLQVNDPVVNKGYRTGMTPEIKREVTMDPQGISKPFSLTQQPESKLNNPLSWTDTIEPVMGLINSMSRDPELYNPVKFRQLKYGLQDVRPILNNNQAEYNAARQGLANSSVGNAQAAQLFSNKLRADGQAIGQYENQNTQIENQEIAANAEIQGKQEMADANSRQMYTNLVNTSKAKQAEAKLTAVGQLANNVGKHNAFNKNASLLMKLAPAFDQNAEYNGRKYNFANNATGVQGTVSNPPGTSLYKVTNRDGKITTEYLNDREYQLRVRNKEYQNIQKIKK